MPSNVMEGLRPEMHRLRSNSVPVAVKLMDCTIEEAGIIFSAAEKASARRRRHLSLDTSTPELSPPSSSATLSSAAYEDSIEVDFVHVKSPTTIPGISTPPHLDDQTPQASPGVMAYNQDMVRFIQERLQSIAPTHPEPPETPKAPSHPSFEPTEYDFSPPRTERPELKSHFSNWSTTSGDSYGPDELIVDLASSPPATGSILEVGDVIEQGRAQVMQFRRRSDMERATPNYFSYPYHGSKPIRAPVLQTPLSAEIRRSSYACSQRGTSPLIDLDATQPDVSRASRGEFFFNLSAPLENHLLASPGARKLGHGLNASPLLSSPRPIRC